MKLTETNQAKILNFHWDCHIQIVKGDSEAILTTVKYRFSSARSPCEVPLKIYDYVYCFFYPKQFASNFIFTVPSQWQHNIQKNSLTWINVNYKQFLQNYGR